MIFMRPDDAAPLDPFVSDRIDQTYAVMATRGGRAVTLIRPSWVRYWLEHGKTPIEIADIALGRRKSSEHPGGTES